MISGLLLRIATFGRQAAIAPRAAEDPTNQSDSFITPRETMVYPPHVVCILEARSWVAVQCSKRRDLMEKSIIEGKLKFYMMTQSKVNHSLQFFAKNI